MGYGLMMGLGKALENTAQLPQQVLQDSRARQLLQSQLETAAVNRALAESQDYRLAQAESRAAELFPLQKEGAQEALEASRYTRFGKIGDDYEGSGMAVPEQFREGMGKAGIRIGDDGMITIKPEVQQSLDAEQALKAANAQQSLDAGRAALGQAGAAGKNATTEATYRKWMMEHPELAFGNRASSNNPIIRALEDVESSPEMKGWHDSMTAKMARMPSANEAAKGLYSDGTYDRMAAGLRQKLAFLMPKATTEQIEAEIQRALGADPQPKTNWRGATSIGPSKGTGTGNASEVY